MRFLVMPACACMHSTKAYSNLTESAQAPAELLSYPGAALVANTTTSLGGGGSAGSGIEPASRDNDESTATARPAGRFRPTAFRPIRRRARDRKSTRLNSSHPSISYAVF